MAPVAAWRRFLAQNGATPGAAGRCRRPHALLSRQLQPLWSVDSIADATFTAVTWAIRALGYDVSADPATKVIGSPDFLIAVDPVCSGIEGIALVTLFVSLYLWLFRAEMRFPLALILYPLGIAASAAFNVVRITVLLVDRARGQSRTGGGGLSFPCRLADVHAGGAGRRRPGPDRARLRRDAPRAARIAQPPFWSDPTVARILPFAVFMLSALAVSTLHRCPARPTRFGFWR